MSFINPALSDTPGAAGSCAGACTQLDPELHEPSEQFLYGAGSTLTQQKPTQPSLRTLLGDPSLG